MILNLFLTAVDSSCTSDGFCTNLPQGAATGNNLQNIISIVLATFGAVAVLIIVIAGLKFVTSQGDPQGVAKARMTIVYALVGLAVAVSAEIIVNFVLWRTS